MLYTHDVDHVIKMFNSIKYSGLAVFPQESMIESDLCHTSCLGKCLHLVVRKVTWMIAEHLCRRMTAYNRELAYLKSIIEAFLTRMTKVNHHTHTVHLCYHLCAKV